MSTFLTPLDVELVVEPGGQEARTRHGKQLWKVINHAFVYYSDIANRYVIIPEGFITDFASIPQTLSGLFGDVGHRASLPHDFEYSNKGTLPRGIVDSMLLEACLLSGVAAWKARAIYAGVRLFGWMFFRKED